jgi:hypothetical protein
MNRILLDPMSAGGGSAAGDSLASPPPDGAGGSKAVTIPADLLPDAKPGDTFKVQSVADGNVTLEHQAAPDEGENWGEGLTKAAAPEGEM